MTRWAWVPVLLLAACIPEDIEEDDFPRYAAGAMCDLEAQCAKGAWLDAYDGPADCQRHYEQYVQQLVEFYDDLDCDYDKGEAGNAVAETAEMDCEDWYEEYVEQQGLDVINEVWECDGGTIISTFSYYP